jgi:hypothetical protein
MSFPRTLAIAAALAPAAPGLAATGTVTFQNGAGGYTSQVNQLISTSNPTGYVTSATTLGVDGYNGTDSPDTQGLIRFNNLFGNAAGQVPVGATIYDARLTLSTQSAVTTPSAVSGGPWGVAALYRPFTVGTTTYADFATDPADTAGTGGNRGAWYQNGTASRPVAGIGNMEGEEKATLNVTDFVRGWADGSLANNGLVVQAGFEGTSDGWIMRSGSHGVQSARPVLSVSYTTEPVTVTRLQNGVNGYDGTVMVKAERDNAIPDLNMVTDGQFIEQDFLDLGSGSTNQTAALRFDDLLAAAAIPADAVILSAHVVITTGETSDNSRTAGEWRLDALADTFDASSLYTDFGPTGPQGELLSSVEGMITGSDVMFDVKSYIEALLAGGENTGFALRSAGTGDGWEIHYTGSSNVGARPELVVAWTTVPEPAALAALALAGGMALRRTRRR